MNKNFSARKKKEKKVSPIRYIRSNGVNPERESFLREDKNTQDKEYPAFFKNNKKPETESVYASVPENIKINHSAFFNSKKTKSVLGRASRRQSEDCQYHGSDISIGNDTGGCGRRVGAVRGQRAGSKLLSEDWRSVAEGCGLVSGGVSERGNGSEGTGGVLLSERYRAGQYPRSEQEVRSIFSTKISGLFSNRKFPVLDNQYFPVVSGLFSHCRRFVAFHFYNISSSFIKAVFRKVSDLTNTFLLTMEMLYRRVINRLDSGNRALDYYKNYRQYLSFEHQLYGCHQIMRKNHKCI